MYSKHPPLPGETPTKVVFEGVEPGSPEAQQLYHENMGEIGRFHGKARQNRTISGQPGSSMQQALPDGGMMRYTYNHGMETIHVKLEPKPVKTPNPSKIIFPLTDVPTLAIDIVMDPTAYVYSYTYAHSVIGGTFSEDILWNYNVLWVAGIVMDPTGAGYEALSTETDFHSDVRPLEYVPTDAGLRTVAGLDRELVHPDDVGDRLSVAGFRANAQVAGAAVVFDVYLGTMAESRTFDDRESPDAVYDYLRALTYCIRVREYQRAPLVKVFQQTLYGRRAQSHSLLGSPPVEHGPVDNPNVGSLPYFSGFLAAEGFVDAYAEPADTRNDGMGLLLAQTAKRARDVVGPRVHGEPPFTEPHWDVPIREMTRAARIEWQPSPSPGVSGTAKIIPA